MAAVLCTWLFVKPCELCGKACEKVGQCCNATCRAVGNCCNATCRTVGNCCDATCGAFNRCMDQCCDSCCRCCDANFGCLCRACDTCCADLGVFMQRPFATCVLFSCFSNAAPGTLALVFSVMAYVGVSNDDCPGNIKLWLVVQAVVCLFHVLMTRHVFYLFQQPYDPTSTGKDKDVESRTSYLLCNDPAAALYILLLIGEVAWLSIGSAWTSEASGCGLNAFVVLAQVMGWGYLIAGCYVFMCSFCCEACGCNCFTWLWRCLFDGDVPQLNRRSAQQGYSAPPQQQHHQPPPQQQPVHVAAAVVNQPTVVVHARPVDGGYPTPQPANQGYPTPQPANQGYPGPAGTSQAQVDADAAFAARLEEATRRSLEQEQMESQGGAAAAGSGAGGGAPPPASTEQAMAAAVGARMGRFFGMNEERASAAAARGAAGTSWAFGRAGEGLAAGARSIQEHRRKQASRQQNV